MGNGRYHGKQKERIRRVGGITVHINREDLRILKNRCRRWGTRMIRRMCVDRPRIIVSMTSYPARINTVHMAIRSLLAQKMLPDCVVLWLCESDFPNREADLPESLLEILSKDVQIRWVREDLRPHKKYYWALQEYRDDYVIIVDDDLLYRNSMIGDLMKTHKIFPNAVVAARTHLITFDQHGRVLPYEQWVYEAPHYHHALVGKASRRLFATNGAGTLYPPQVHMPQETFNMADIQRLCLTADDLWLKVMQLRVDIPVVAATDDQLLRYVPGTQGEEALCHENTENGANNVILAAILDALRTDYGWTRQFAEMVWDPTLDEYVK